MNDRSDLNSISQQTLRRLPFYLSYLQGLINKEEEAMISAAAIARALGLNEVQVRKDLALISTNAGRPKTGYLQESLISDIESFLGYKNINEAVLVGAGHLGQALLSYQGFSKYGLNILAAFDVDPALEGRELYGKTVFPMYKIIDLTRRLKVRIGIITVPGDEAQQVCDMLVEAGVLAIWNFAPVKLMVPEPIMVQSENMAASLALLSRHLDEKFTE